MKNKVIGIVGAEIAKGLKQNTTRVRLPFAAGSFVPIISGFVVY